MKKTSLKVEAGTDLEINLQPGKILEKRRGPDGSLVLQFATEGNGAKALIAEGMKCVLKEDAVTRQGGAIRKIMASGGRLTLECRFPVTDNPEA